MVEKREKNKFWKKTIEKLIGELLTIIWKLITDKNIYV